MATASAGWATSAEIVPSKSSTIRASGAASTSGRNESGIGIVLASFPCNGAPLDHGVVRAVRGRGRGCLLGSRGPRVVSAEGRHPYVLRVAGDNLVVDQARRQA